MMSFYNDVYRLIKERRLPIRLQKLLDEVRYKPKFNASLRLYLSKGGCIDNHSDDLEVHIITSNNDAMMAACALKSLFSQGLRAKAVIHGDSTFSKENAKIFYQLLRSCRVIYPEEKLTMKRSLYEMRSKLAPLFLLHQEGIGMLSSEGSRKAWAQKIFDFHYYSESQRFIILDSDTLFMSEPKELIEWSARGGCNLYAQPFYSNLRIEKSLLKKHFSVDSAIEKFNGGLLAIDKATLSLESVMDAVEHLLGNPSVPVYGDECVWRILFSKVDSFPLSLERYPLIGTRKKYNEIKASSYNYCYIHFLLKYRYGIYSNHLIKLAK